MDPNPSIFQHEAKKIRKTFISTVFRLLHGFLSVKNYVNEPSKSIKQKKLKKKNYFLLAS